MHLNRILLFYHLHFDRYSYLIDRLDLFNIEFTVDGGVFVTFGSFKWMEIGQTFGHHTHGLVLFVHFIGINV